MGLLKRFKELLSWCPQPSDRSPTKLKRYSVPIIVAAAATIVLALSFSVFSSSLTSQPLVPPAPAPHLPTLTSAGPITIEADGNVQPANAPVQRDENIYMLTSSLYNSPITVLRNNAIVLGSGYASQGVGSGVALNLTCTGTSVTGFCISNWAVGVLGVYYGNAVSNCNITGNNRGIAIYADDYSVLNNYLANNQWAVRIQGNETCVSNNQIVGNTEGFYITSSSGNTIYRNDISNNPTAISTDYGGFVVYQNNFSNNTTPVVTAYDALNKANTSAMPSWNYHGVGNYWADYQAKYPNAATDSSGVWSQPYVVDANSGILDEYPLSAQVPLSEVTVTTQTSQPKLATPSLYIVLIYAVAGVTIALVAVLAFMTYRQHKTKAAIKEVKQKFAEITEHSLRKTKG